MPTAYPYFGTINRTVLYLRSHRRRPVQLCPPLGLTDPQAQLPFAWCPGCGRELYRQPCSHCKAADHE